MCFPRQGGSRQLKGQLKCSSSAWRKKENPKLGLGFALGDLGGWWGDRQELGHTTALAGFRSRGFQDFQKYFCPVAAVELYWN
jgi:hypothetical protein